MPLQLAGLLLAGTLLVAGCTGKSHSSTSTTNPTNTMGTTSSCLDCGGHVEPPRAHGSIEFNDCLAYFTGFVADTNKMQALLPTGYSPAPTAANIESVGLDFRICDSVVVNNQTVIRNVGMAMVGAVVNVPPGVHDAGRTDGYAFELIVTSPEVQTAFQQHGFNAKLGTVQLTAANQTIEGHVGLGGAPLYDLMAAGDTGTGALPTTDLLRIHQSDGSHRVWFNMTNNDKHSELTDGEVLTVHGGAIQQLSITGDIGLNNSQIAQGSAKYDFST